MMKQTRFIKWVILIVIGVIVIPVSINEAYKFGKGYVTMWDAADMLSYYGAVLSFAGTVILGLIATKQNQRANDLTNRMLELEESKELPIVDIVEITDSDGPVSTDKLKNSLEICLNNTYFRINDDGTLADKSCSIAVFRLVNICSNYIISLAIDDVTQAATFSNGKSIITKIDEIEYNGEVRVLGCNESQYLLIGGVDFEYPTSLTGQELAELGYITPVIELTITFLLGNIKGKKYCETIKMRYVYIPGEGRIDYPSIIEKEILSIDEYVARH